MKTITVHVLLLAMAFSGISQTSLQGKVTDAHSGEPVILGTAALYQNGAVVAGTQTDFKGYYSFIELNPGTYDAVFSYTGYMDVKVVGGYRAECLQLMEAARLLEN